MFTYFRRIRYRLLGRMAPSKKYLLYALGEILLVVFGILIALQVNNWNSNRIDQLRLKEYATSLIQDIEADIFHINAVIHHSKRKQQRIDSLANYVRGKDLTELLNVDILFLSTRIMYRPHAWNRATLNELKSSGNLRNIKNDSLAKAIVAYEAFTYHLDQDYLNDQAYRDQASEFTSLIVNSNYPNIDNIFRMLGRTDDAYGKVDIFQSPEYKEAAAYKLDFISDDISLLNNAVNLLINLKLYLAIRSDVEFPEHIKNANSIIKMLKAEYGE